MKSEELKRFFLEQIKLQEDLKDLDKFHYPQDVREITVRTVVAELGVTDLLKTAGLQANLAAVILQQLDVGSLDYQDKIDQYCATYDAQVDTFNLILYFGAVAKKGLTQLAPLPLQLFFDIADQLPILTMEDLALFMDCSDPTSPLNLTEFGMSHEVNSISAHQVKTNPLNEIDVSRSAPPLLATGIEHALPSTKEAEGCTKRRRKPTSFFGFEASDFATGNHRAPSFRSKRSRPHQEIESIGKDTDDAAQEIARKKRARQYAAEHRDRKLAEQNNSIAFLNQLNQTNAALLTEVGLLRAQIAKQVKQIHASKDEGGSHQAALL